MNNFASFIAATIPSAIALLISLNLGGLVNTIQKSLLTPAISLIPGGNISELKYIAQTSPEIVFHFGDVLINILNFVIICFIAYLIVLFLYKTTSVDGMQKLT